MSNRILSVLRDHSFFLMDCLKENLPSFFYKRALNRKIKKTKYIQNFSLSKAHKKEVADYWRPYEKVNSIWHETYLATSGIWDVRYIPEDVFYRRIESHYNRPELNRAYADKNQSDKLFAGIKMPKTVIRNINHYFYTESYELIDKNTAVQTLVDFARGEKFVIKPSIISGSGKNVKIIDVRGQSEAAIQGEIVQLFQVFKHDFIVQKYLYQHPLLDAMHEKSLNTLRIITLRLHGKIHVLSAILRIGDKGAQIDNAESGFLTVGMNDQGCLKGYAIENWNFKKMTAHPYSGFEFADVQVPSVKEAHELVKLAHSKVYYFDIISWDLGLDTEGTPTLIEMNMKDQDINYHQRVNGPLFGDHTEDVLKEVYGLGVN